MERPHPTVTEEVSVEKLAQFANPFTGSPWVNVKAGEVTLQMVMESLAVGDFEPNPWSLPVTASEEAESFWLPERHAARIAYLAKHGWNDPVRLYLNIGEVDLVDGWHRLGAAIFRFDKTIAVQWTGAQQTLDRLKP